MSLSAKKRERIKSMGGRVTSAGEWLDLSPEEIAVIDMKIRLGEQIKARRRKKRLSQESLAKLLKTSQGRVSKLEKGQATLDQLARSLLALGGSSKDVGQTISG